MAGIRALFLDVDGVINEAIIENGKPVAPISLAELKIPAEVKPSLDKASNAGYILICVTNKPDVIEGRMSQEDVDDIFKKLYTSLPITEIFACYDRQAPCFKPQPGMLNEAADKYDIDFNQSFLIGDRHSDIEAGRACGCKTIWIDRKYETEQIPNPAADYTTDSLSKAIDWILEEQ